MLTRWEEIKNRSIQSISQSLKKKEFSSDCKIGICLCGLGKENLKERLVKYCNDVNEYFETKEVVQVLDCSTNERIGVQIIYKEKK